MAANLATEGLDTLEALGIACWSRPWAASVEEVLSRQVEAFDVVYLNGTSVAGRYAALVGQTQPRARLVVNVDHLASLELARRHGLGGEPDLLAAPRCSNARRLFTPTR